MAGVGPLATLTLLSVASKAGRHRTSIIAHELGHLARRHSAKFGGIAFAGAGVDVLILGQAGANRPAFSSSISHVPIFYVISVFSALIVTPAIAWISRRFEADADRFTLDLTRDPRSFIETMEWPANVLMPVEATCEPSDAPTVGTLMDSVPEVRVKVAGVEASAGTIVKAPSVKMTLVKNTSFRNLALLLAIAVSHRLLSLVAIYQSPQ